MKLNNGLFEVGGEQIGVGVPVLAIEHTDMSAMSESMAGMGIPNFMLPALMGESTTVDIPFEDDGAYRIVDTNGLVSLTGYVWVQSFTLQGMEIKILFCMSLQGGVMQASAQKQEDGKWLISMDM